MNLELQILKNRARLEKMITEEKEYKEILKQSKKLDKLLNKKMAKILQNQAI